MKPEDKQKSEGLEGKKGNQKLTVHTTYNIGKIPFFIENRFY